MEREDKTMSRMIHLNKIQSDENGTLSFFEGSRHVPFEIKRVYYTYDVPIDTQRGMHAHKHLHQAMWCPYGSIEIILDNGVAKTTYFLDEPEKLLLVQPGIWRDIYWRKEGSVLCVAVSDYYLEEDYIRDYDEFIKYVQEGYWHDENQL